MSEVLLAPLVFVKNVTVAIGSTILLPLKLLIQLLYLIYKLVFSLQFFMSGTCISLFGEGFGCDIINPNYVFTTLILAIVKFVVISHVGKAVFKTWKNWNKEN
jgi:hypothetical protein